MATPAARSAPPTLDASTLRDLPRALELEWLETNGLGGFASATVTGAHTRRYHGLLTAAIQPPVVRQNLLTALDVSVIHDDQTYPLSCHLFPGTVHPQGHMTLVRLELDPFPRWVHRPTEGPTVIHELWMDPWRNTTVMIWRLPADSPPAELAVVPILALRDFHDLTEHRIRPPARIQSGARHLIIEPEDPAISPLHLYHTAEGVEPFDRWVRAFRLPVEKAREHDWSEDRWCPCEMHFTLEPDSPAVLIATVEEEEIPDPMTFAEESLVRRLEAERVCTLVETPPDPAIARLATAVRPFRVTRADGRPTVVAGYHWFTDWGRDTMIALPGLFLVHGHTGEALATLRTWMGHVDGGMIPNRFPDSGEPPEYNTVDGALWLAVAVLRTWRCLGGRGAAGLIPNGDPWKTPSVPPVGDLSNEESSFLHEALDTVERIIASYREGTRHGIRMDEDGLITQGEAGLQLTWMDAKWEDQVFTPRHGKPIEIQALWFNTLCTAALLRRVHGDMKTAKEHETLARQVRTSTEAAFRDPSRCELADVIAPGGARDWSIRPNQIFAVSLPFPLVSPLIAADVLTSVEEHLLTPYGLRSLAPGDPQYVGVYHGPREVRDAAYHRGTVWSWLIGPYVDAALRVRDHTPENAAELRAALQPLVDHVGTQHGLGSVSEIFDGDAPHAPKGCIAQAWSVAELLRALWVVAGVG